MGSDQERAKRRATVVERNACLYSWYTNEVAAWKRAFILDEQCDRQGSLTSTKTRLRSLEEYDSRPDKYVHAHSTIYSRQHRHGREDQGINNELQNVKTYMMNVAEEAKFAVYQLSSLPKHPAISTQSMR